MAKFVFKLQNLLRIKEKLETQRKMEFGQAISYREQQQEIKEQLIDQKQQKIENFKDSIYEKINPSEIAMYNDYIQLIKTNISKQDDILIEARKQVELRRQSLETAVKEHKIYGKLRENRHTEHKFLEQRNEQKETDGLISYKYTKKNV